MSSKGVTIVLTMVIYPSTNLVNLLLNSKNAIYFDYKLTPKLDN